MSGQGKLRLDDRSEQALAQLLGRIVHDFNNPLAAIIGFADLLRNPSLAEEKRSRYVNRIYEQAIKLSQLVETMSYFSSTPPLQEAPFSLTRSVQELLSLREGGFQAAGIVLEQELGEEELHASGDRAAVIRILHNLLNNAEQVFKENPLIDKRIVRIRCGTDGDQAVVEVEDSGPGVSADVASEVFAPFFSTRRSGGLGLGLTISRGLAEKMGGTLELVGEKGALGGATFRLSLPVAPGSA